MDNGMIAIMITCFLCRKRSSSSLTDSSSPTPFPPPVTSSSSWSRSNEEEGAAKVPKLQHDFATIMNLQPSSPVASSALGMNGFSSSSPHVSSNPLMSQSQGRHYQDALRSPATMPLAAASAASHPSQPPLLSTDSSYSAPVSPTVSLFDHALLAHQPNTPTKRSARSLDKYHAMVRPLKRHDIDVPVDGNMKDV